MKNGTNPTSQGVYRRSFSNTYDALCLYIDYHSIAAKKIIKAFGSTLLIDCHSNNLFHY